MQSNRSIEESVLLVLARGSATVPEITVALGGMVPVLVVKHALTRLMAKGAVVVNGKAMDPRSHRVRWTYAPISPPPKIPRMRF